MSSNFQKFLKKESENSLYSGKGDENNNGLYYLANNTSLFFTQAARELVKDGVDPKSLMSFLMGAAEDTLTGEEFHGEKAKKARKTMRDYVLSYHGMFRPTRSKKPREETKTLLRKEQRDADQKILDLCNKLKKEDGVTRKELWRSLTSTALMVMKAEGFDEDYRSGVEEVMKDIAREIKEPDDEKKAA